MISGPMQVLIILIAAMLNGFVILLNTAMNTVSRNAVKGLCDDDDNDDKAEKLLYVLEQPTEYRFTNRLLSYIFIAVVLVFAVRLPYNDAATAVIAVIAMVIFTEYLPRKIAHQHNIKIAMRFTGVQKFFMILLKPFVSIFTIIVNIILRIFRQSTDMEYSGYSEEQVMSILEAGQQSGAIKEEGKKMINSIFQFDDELAYEIMTPRTDVFLIDINDPPEEYLDQLMELRYSRIPVCEDETDNIIGILHIKDYLIKAREEGFDKVDIRSILRKPYFIPETKNIDSLFFELQVKKQHIAVLIDEYGGFSGIVTMEDLVEEIVGDIDDEYDEEAHIIQKVDDNTYYVDGNVSLDDINEEMGSDLESENSETIGGFIIDILGEIPEDGETETEVEFEKYIFTILSVKEKRIEKVKITIAENDESEEEEDSE